MKYQRLKPQWFHILLALAEGPRHGMGIRKEVLEQTEGAVKLWPAMLYGSLDKLVEAGLIEELVRTGPEADGDRRRFYRITANGQQRLSLEVARTEEYVRIARERRVGSADSGR